MSGIFMVDSYFILYQSSTTNEYSSSMCQDYSTDIFKSGKNYLFENTVSFAWNYDNSTSVVIASKSLSLEATTPPTSSECVVTSHDGNAVELLSIFNFTCVN